MTRLDTFLLLLLAGIGWGCGFALIGLAVFKGVPDNGPLVTVFAVFGFAAGAALAALRLAMERQLPRSLSGSLRSAEESSVVTHDAGTGASASAFGA